MITATNIKKTAVLVGAMAGIVGGIDKIKTTIQKWRAEYKEKVGEHHAKRADSIDEQ